MGLSESSQECHAGSELTIADQAIAGLGAGVAVSCLACPTELMKCRLQAQASSETKAEVRLTCSALREALSLCQGLFLTLSVPHQQHLLMAQSTTWLHTEHTCKISRLNANVHHVAAWEDTSCAV